MPENPGNRCTSCPLVTSKNEKTCRPYSLSRVCMPSQAADIKGYGSSCKLMPGLRKVPARRMKFLESSAPTGAVPASASQTTASVRANGESAEGGQWSAVSRFQRTGSRLLSLELLFNFLDFLSERLIKQAGTFAPGFTFRLWLSRVSSHFAAVNILVTLLLTLKFCAQFIFRHSIT